MRPLRKFSAMAKRSKFLPSLTPSTKSPSLLSPIPKISPPKHSFFPLNQSLSFFCSDSSPPKKIILQTERGAHCDNGSGFAEDLGQTVSDLAVELSVAPDLDTVSDVLESKAATLFRDHPDGSASIALLSNLKSSPQTALEVFYWKRKQVEVGIPMVPEEYAKAITLAGRIKNIDLALELFSEAGIKGLQTQSVYNSLMSAYMYNGVAQKTLSIFEDLRKDPKCRPNIVTYNILLSVFGRSMLVDHMERVLRVIKESNLAPNLHTYNTVIAGYVTAWMWDDMERTFQSMEAGGVLPDVRTYQLMLRGYAHSGNLEKMEKTYELIKEEVSAPLVRTMICAYCKSSDSNRIKKIEALMCFLSEDQYMPWLNVLLIRVYAQEDVVERMESSISKALEHNTLVTTINVMHSIISSYFRCNAVDRLSMFVKHAESAGWRLCRSLYHCKMVMYGSQNRLEEMESVLDEMEVSRFNPTKKTFWIMYNAYLKSGENLKVERLLATMCKLGFGIPLDPSLS